MQCDLVVLQEKPVTDAGKCKISEFKYEEVNLMQLPGLEVNHLEGEENMFKYLIQ